MTSFADNTHVHICTYHTAYTRTQTPVRVRAEPTRSSKTACQTLYYVLQDLTE